MSILNKVRAANEKRRLYNRTLAELQALSRREALDLGFYPEDAHTIAYRSVYGQ